MNRNSTFGLTIALCLLFSCQVSADNAIEQPEQQEASHEGQAGAIGAILMAAQASRPEFPGILETARAQIPQNESDNIIERRMGSRLVEGVSAETLRETFDPRLFDRLEQFHTRQHQLAQQALQRHQEGQAEAAKNAYKELLLINAEIELLLQQFDLFG